MPEEVCFTAELDALVVDAASFELPELDLLTVNELSPEVDEPVATDWIVIDEASSVTEGSPEAVSPPSVEDMEITSKDLSVPEGPDAVTSSVTVVIC